MLARREHPDGCYRVTFAMARKRNPKESGGRGRRPQLTEAGARIGHLWCAAHAVSQSASSVSRAYVATARQVGRRLTLGLDALSMKRGACKECGTLRIGDGARVRVRARRERKVVVTCGRCGKVRRYLARPPREEGGGKPGGDDERAGGRSGDVEAGPSVNTSVEDTDTKGKTQIQKGKES